MTFDESLSTGPLFATWEGWSPRPDRRLVLFSVQPKPAMLAQTEVPKSERDTMSDQLRRRGVRIGSYAPLNDLFWCVDDQGFVLWSMARIEAEGKHGDLHLADGRDVKGAQVKSVTSFVEDDRVHRGVRLALADGSNVVVAEEEDLAETLDPGYNVDNLTIDAAWADYLGRALAEWFGKPHVNEVP